MRLHFTRFLFWPLAFLLVSTVSAQDVARSASVNQHPEAGKTSHPALLHQPQSELFEKRTRFSRTFRNTNSTYTTVQSSVPMHYQDRDGQWLTIDYRAAQQGQRFVYPAQDPVFEIDKRHAAIALPSGTVKFNQKAEFGFVSGGQVVKKFSTSTELPELKSDVLVSRIAPMLEQHLMMYPGVMKYNYRIDSASFFPQGTDELQIDASLTLPQGHSLKTDDSGSQVHIADASGAVVLTLWQPIATDSKVLPRHGRTAPLEGRYVVAPIGNGKFGIRMVFDGAWFKSADRVYPVTIDPVMTVASADIVNSCLTPNYQQSTLQVDVPAGQNILSSEVSYNFVAVEGSGAWTGDQSSFVSGPNGQTPVQQGQGSTAGTQVYTFTNSSIANVVSPGQVTFTFHIGRSWGGTGCNAQYNFVNQRQVAVTYGTIEFGNGPLLINEYSASNRTFNDNFGRDEDWIELYNASPDTYFNLAGYHVSNNINNPTKWQIESGVIPPNSRMLIFCSERDITSGTVLHTSFDLTQTDGDEVVLADPSGNILESYTMFVTQTNHSYGRTSDGASTWSIFTAPTPGQANANGFANYATKPVFNTAPGNYPAAISVTLAAPGPDEQIRYTLNGATPTIASPLYTGPIAIGQSTVIRARSFSSTPGILPGFIETNTYFINENSSFPVASISGDSDLLQLLNGNSGVIPTAYFEYFENGAFIDENMGDFDAHGNDSWAYDQRGIDFVSRDDHGYKRRLEHKFFDTSDRTGFRRLILKAAGSDNYPHQPGGMHFRDVFVQTVSQVADLELDERRASFISLFVNGQYWGVYDLREKVDDNQYTDYYYGQDVKYRDANEYIQYIKTWGSTQAEFGNQPALDAWNQLITFVQNNDMSVQANYDYVEGQLNIDSLVDYFVLNSYMVNRDWLNWNTSWWRGTNPSGGALKWRYALWDTDGVLGHYTNFTGIPDTSANADPCQVEQLEVGVGHAQTIGKLIEENPTVRQKYITRYADLLNTHLSCESIIEVFDSIVTQLTPEMPRQIARWGGSMQEWQANVLAAKNFLLTRCSQTISTGLTECYEVTGPYPATLQVVPAIGGKIRMNSELIANYPFTAQIFGNIETLLKGEPNPGFIFDHWVVDGAVINPNATSQEIMLMIAQATTITAHFKDVVNTSTSVVHYWHFNELQTPSDVTQIPSDFSAVPEALGLMTYTGTGLRDIDAGNEGSDLNLHFDQPAGQCARVRNPSDGRFIVFDVPTTGFRDIRFAYALQRTSSGQLVNNISYTIDGTNYITDGMSQTSFNAGTNYSLIEVDLSALTTVDNNPNFKIKIVFSGNTTADNGNNRFDNVSIKGAPMPLSVDEQSSAFYVVPNPFTSDVRIQSAVAVSEISVYDMIGKLIVRKPVALSYDESIDLSGLNQGVYLMKIRTDQGEFTRKLVKQ